MTHQAVRLFTILYAMLLESEKSTDWKVPFHSIISFLSRQSRALAALLESSASGKQVGTILASHFLSQQGGI